MSGKHAFLSPSGYDAWSQCLGKPALEEHLPDSSSPDADYGTLAHEFAARWLATGRCPWPHEGDPFNGGFISGPAEPDGSDMDMRAGVTLYVRAVLESMDNYRKLGATVFLYVEQQLPIGAITGEKDATGTSDAIVIADFGKSAILDPWDLKFGVGVKVPVEGNGQLQMYGLAALLRYGQYHNITELNLTIHQPRVRAEPIRWTRTPEDLLVFGSEVTDKAAKALALRNSMEALNSLTPGQKQCRFCRAKTHCKAYAGWVSQGVLEGMEGFHKPESVTIAVEGKGLILPPEEHAKWLAEQLKKVALARAWCDAISDAAMVRALEGYKLPGWKLVDGRAGNRTFTDPGQVLTLLVLEGVAEARVTTKPELVTVTQLEKILPPKQHADLWEMLTDPLDGYIVQKKPAPALVEESDPRPPRQTQARISDFEGAQ
jgi:hypothetical protein